MGYLRTIDELITLYDIEPELNEVFTEGLSDEIVISKLFKLHDIAQTKVKVTEIDDIDFSSKYTTHPSIINNNKNKLILLAKTMKEEIDETLSGVSIIIDYDFDHIIEKTHKIPYINYYDYNSLELYCWNETIINDFYTSMLHGFPHDARKTLNSLSETLTELFIIRACFEYKQSTPEGGLVDIKKSITYHKNGKIDFNKEQYFNKNLMKANALKDKTAYIELYENLKSKLHEDTRMNIRGHDFIHLFHSYVKEHKSKAKLTEEMFDRALQNSINYHELRKEKLFEQLIIKYS